MFVRWAALRLLNGRSYRFHFFMNSCIPRSSKLFSFQFWLTSSKVVYSQQKCVPIRSLGSTKSTFNRPLCRPFNRPADLCAVDIGSLFVKYVSTWKARLLANLVHNGYWNWLLKKNVSPFPTRCPPKQHVYLPLLTFRNV